MKFQASVSSELVLGELVDGPQDGARVLLGHAHLDVVLDAVVQSTEVDGVVLLRVCHRREARRGLLAPGERRRRRGLVLDRSRRRGQLLGAAGEGLGLQERQRRRRRRRERLGRRQHLVRLLGDGHARPPGLRAEVQVAHHLRKSSLRAARHLRRQRRLLLAHGVLQGLEPGRRHVLVGHVVRVGRRARVMCWYCL